MFDLRYHVASLAAVFLALVIGILVGVGISDRGLVDKAQRGLLQQRIDRLEGQLSDARRRSQDLAAQQRAAQAYIADTYPTLMANRLRGKSIALIFLGPAQPDVRTALEQALTDAGARGWVRVRALKLPFAVPAIDKTLAGERSLRRYVGDLRLPALGRAMAEEFALGGEAPLWTALAEQLVEERSGGEDRPADGVIVVRSGLNQYDGAARFLEGFYQGLIAAPVPVVGVETANASESAVSAFRRHGISSVDDVDQPSGRLALALLLVGAKAGHYGLKRGSEDGILPPLETVARGG